MIPTAPFILLILAIPIFFLSKWALRKLKAVDEKNIIPVAISSAVLLSLILYVGIILMLVFSYTYYPKTEFNKKVWNENKEERFKMSNDIIESNMLIGKTKQEVIEILGSDFYKYSENHIGYYLGFVPRLLTIDPDMLGIHFKGGKVVKVVQHES